MRRSRFRLEEDAKEEAGNRGWARVSWESVRNIPDVFVRSPQREEWYLHCFWWNIFGSERCALCSLELSPNSKLLGQDRQTRNVLMGGADTGNMLLNFFMDKSIFPFAGVDLTTFLGEDDDCLSLWYHCRIPFLILLCHHFWLLFSFYFC
jgi:hypothetical protein